MRKQNQRIKRVFTITHVFASGLCISHEELLKNGFEVKEEGNQLVFENLYRLVDPLYDKHRQYRAKLQENKKRQDEIIMELKQLQENE